MTEDEIERLADLLFDKIMQRQEEADAEYAEQIQKLVNEGYVISDHHVEKFKDELGLDEILNQLQHLFDYYGEDRYRPNPLLRKMAADKATFF